MKGRKASPGDTRIAPNGYHYTRLTDKWELTHRILMEKELGRPLQKGERVKFIDGDKTNIVIENLELTESDGGEAQELARYKRLVHKYFDIIGEMNHIRKSLGLEMINFPNDLSDDPHSQSTMIDAS